VTELVVSSFGDQAIGFMRDTIADRCQEGQKLGTSPSRTTSRFPSPGSAQTAGAVSSAVSKPGRTLSRQRRAGTLVVRRRGNGGHQRRDIDAPVAHGAHPGND
jgi:hypothetical protein